VAGLFQAAGFSVRLEHHWYGLTGITDRLFGTRGYPRGLAPLARLWAVKRPSTGEEPLLQSMSALSRTTGR
jgi:hypothetical protein